jgi:hypothetical protein
MMTMTSEGGGSVREAVLINLWAHCAESAAATYVRCPEGKPSFSQTLLDQGRTLLNILAVLPSRTHA